MSPPAGGGGAEPGGDAELERLLGEVLSGANSELRRLAAEGILPLPPRDLVALQARLATSEEEEIAAAAGASLEALEPGLLVDVVDEGLPAVALGWIAGRIRHPLVLEAVLRSRWTPAEVLEQAAPRLAPELQEVLLLRQDRIVEAPSILDALETNPKLSRYSRRRIGEYRRHLLPREQQEEEGAAEDTEAVEPSDLEVEEAVAEARQEPAEGEVEPTLGLSESQVRLLPVPVRLKLSRNAPRVLRAFLVRDANPQVAVSVLHNNQLADSEVEQIARNRAVVEDVLAAVARNQAWVRKYPIVLALVRNPRTPVGTAVRFVSRLSVRDLLALSRDRNVTDAVRSAAGRLYKIKVA